MLSDVSYTFENITNSEKCAEKLPNILESLFSIGNLRDQLKVLIDNTIQIPDELDGELTGFKRMTALVNYQLKKNIATTLINIINSTLSPILSSLDALRGAIDSGISKTYCDSLNFATNQPLGKQLKKIALASIKIEKKFTNIKEYLKLENMTLERLTYFARKNANPLNFLRFSFGDNQEEVNLQPGVNNVSILIPKKFAAKTFILPNGTDVDTEIVNLPDGISIKIPNAQSITLNGNYSVGESVSIPIDTEYFETNEGTRVLNAVMNGGRVAQTGGGELPFSFQVGGSQYVKVSNGMTFKLNTLHDLISLEKYKITLL